MNKKPEYVIARFGTGGHHYLLVDDDLRNMLRAIQHSVIDGFLEDDREWAEEMINRIQILMGSA